MNVIIDHVTLPSGHLVLHLCFGTYYVHALDLAGGKLHPVQRFRKLERARVWIKQIAGVDCKPAESRGRCRLAAVQSQTCGNLSRRRALGA